MKKSLIFLIIALIIIVIGLIAYPHIEIKTADKLFVCRYSDDLSEFEDNASYNELYFYNQKRDISIKSFDVKNFLFFYLLELEYTDGDFRKTQFVLEEEYIKNWIENAEITDNPNNIDIKALIADKKAVVSNKRYLGNDYENIITFKLDGRYDELSVFYVEDLLVIQVGSPDELPKFIAYRQ